MADQNQPRVLETDNPPDASASLSADPLTDIRAMLLSMSARLSSIEKASVPPPAEQNNSGTVRDSDEQPTDAARGGHRSAESENDEVESVSETDMAEQEKAGPSSAVGTASGSARGVCESSMTSLCENNEDSFCVEFSDSKNEQDVFSILEGDLEEEEKLGPAVDEKLSKIAKNRFQVRLPEQKLKEKLNKYPLPQNCAELKPPVLNTELCEKGYVSGGAKKSDARLVNVQRMVSSAASVVISAMQKLHDTAASLAARDCSARDKTVVEAANSVISTQADALAILGMASQELSMRRKFQLQFALPREVQSICSQDTLSSTDQLFGGDLDKALRAARESHKHGQNKRSERFKPYPHNKRSQNFAGKPFLGQSPSHFKSPKGKGGSGKPPASGFGKWRR